MFESIKSWPRRAKMSTTSFMKNKLGFSNRQVDLSWHWLRLLRDQVLAVMPISLLQYFVLLVFFQVGIEQAGLQVMGLFLAIVGLSMFLDGLRIVVIPIAELLGEELPKRLPLPLVLLVAGFLGVLVTYAEPAIASLGPLADLIDPERAPYLFFIMNQQKELMVLSIGLGVGVAAILGTVRFIKDWPLKPLIFSALAPTIGTACYMQWGNPNLAPAIGLAWDCGGVTTGPVTVPVLLSLGIGCMRSTRKRRLAQAALESSVAAGAGQSLEGFGIVTLASLFPILAVQLMAIVDGIIYDEDYILNEARKAALAAQTATDAAIDTSPLKEVVYSIRAIMPLVAALILLVVVVLRVPLPELSFWVEPSNEDDGDVSVHSTTSEGKSDLSRASMAISKGLEMSIGMERHDSESTIDDGSAHGGNAAMAAMAPDVVVVPSPSEEAETKVGCWTRTGRWMRNQLPLLGGIVFLQVGVIAFNEGLTYAFTKLGDQTGLTLPAAFLELPNFPKSPYYSYAGGLILVLVVIFLLGILATRAEPALNVLGRTVERLSGGSFTSSMLIRAVCLGVGIGLAAGAAKIIYILPIIYFILAKYTIAIILTIFSAESITAVGWDSAGVTTGPVTVPIVLSIGVGLSIAVDSPEGFGLLTIASVAPIISVLFSNIIKKPAAAARRTLSLGARSLSRNLTSRRSERLRRQLQANPSFAMAAFAADAGASVGPTPDVSVHNQTEGAHALQDVRE